MKRGSDTLNEMIILTEHKQAIQLHELKEQLHTTYESILPYNIIKNTLAKVRSSPDIKTTIINSVIGLGTGFLSKKILVGRSHNPVKNLFGTLIEFAVAGFVSKHPDGIKSTVKNFLERIFKHTEHAAKEYHKLHQESSDDTWVIK